MSKPLTLSIEVAPQTISLEKRIQVLEERIVELEANNVTLKVIEMTVTKLEPTEDDVVVFWMPPELTHSQVHQIGQSFDSVIAGRFRYIMLVRGGVEIQMIKKTPGLLRVQ